MEIFPAQGENIRKWTNNKLWPFYQKIRKEMDNLGMRDKLVFADFITDQDENVYPMIEAGKAHNEMILS